MKIYTRRRRPLTEPAASRQHNIEMRMHTIIVLPHISICIQVGISNRLANVSAHQQQPHVLQLQQFCTLKSQPTLAYEETPAAVNIQISYQLRNYTFAITIGL